MLEQTSERVDEDHYRSTPREFLIYLIHVHTYDFAIAYVRGCKALDLGCGTGYGTSRIAPECREIVGVDVDAGAVEHAMRRFAAPNASFRTIKPAEEAPLPFGDAEFDVVLSFQVIEHLHDVPAYLSEIRRVLRPGGVFICATPDRTGRLYPFQKPWNSWHVNEYRSDQLTGVLRPYFTSIEMFKQGATPKVTRMEMNRTKWARRCHLVRWIPIVRKVVRYFSKWREEPTEIDFDLTDFHITRDASQSFTLVAVAR